MSIDNRFKHITKSQLIKVLITLPDNFLIGVNHVGNLIIANEEQEYIGYIDFLNGELQMIDRED
jgi:hypothetical protein